jgi:hypothetical protein
MLRCWRSAVAVVTVAILCGGANASAFQSFAPAIDAWSYVTDLQPGTFVRVTEFPRHRTAGKLIRVDDARIIVEEGIQPTPILRSNVVEVERRLPNHDVRNGFVWGAAFGFVNALVAVRRLNGPSLAFGALLTLGDGGIGAIAGGLASVFGRQYVVVFNRP